MPEITLNSNLLFILIGWSCLLALAFVCQIIWAIRIRNRKLVFLLLPVFAIQWFFNQCFTGYQHNPLNEQSTLALVKVVFSWPVYALIGIQLVLTVLLVVFGIQILAMTRNRVTNQAIKEGMDDIQTGFCWYYPDGFVVMKNRQMNELSVRLTGNQLLNGVQFEEIIEQKDFRKRMTQEESSKLNNDYLISVDEEVWEISVKRNTDPKQPAQMNAKNVTEEYAITRSLIEKQKELKELSTKLSAYNQKIAETVTNQEILNAKARIHDELGIALLTAKRYLSDTGESVTREAEREKVIRLLKENIHVLYEDTPDDNKGDEYELMFRTAEQVLVQIQVDGTLPQKEPAKHLTAMAIHECITNTIRHAGGDVVRIKAEQCGPHRIDLTFTNNGKKPEKEIVPKGGLSSLQTLVDQAGGRMKIESFPEFNLYLTLYS